MIDRPGPTICVMLIYSMSVSVDGFITDREGGFGWGPLARSCFASTPRW